MDDNPSDPFKDYRDYNKGMDFIFQQIQDRKDQALFARIKATCYLAPDEEIRAFLTAARTIGRDRGMSVVEAREYGDLMIEKGLDMDIFDVNMDVKT